MVRSYWSVNSYRSRVERLIETTKNKDKFLNIIDPGKITYSWGK